MLNKISLRGVKTISLRCSAVKYVLKAIIISILQVLLISSYGNSSVINVLDNFLSASFMTTKKSLES